MITITSPIPILLFFAALLGFFAFCVIKDTEGWTFERFIKKVFNK